MRVRWEIAAAIDEAVKAGVFRRAERLNPHSALTWGRLAEPHSQRVAELLGKATSHASVRFPRRSSG